MSPKRNHSLELHYRSNSRNRCGGEIAVVLLHGRSRRIAFIRRLGCILGVKVSIGGFNMGASITLYSAACYNMGRLLFSYLLFYQFRRSL
ncbi:hypothetical protein QL285_063954 [Trifolium repens]|nr:hypothetical protein QL285_063954 [Trifolium repens]